MKHIRLLVIVTGLLLSLAPIAAQAQGIPDLDRQNRLIQAQNRAAALALGIQSEYFNDLARCQIAAAGGTVTGDKRECASLSSPFIQMPTSTTTTSTAPTGACVEAMRPLTSAENDTVNEFEIAVNRALAVKLPAPTMSPAVSALIGCL